MQSLSICTHRWNQDLDAVAGDDKDADVDAGDDADSDVDDEDADNDEDADVDANADDDADTDDNGDADESTGNDKVISRLVVLPCWLTGDWDWGKGGLGQTWSLLFAIFH